MNQPFFTLELRRKRDVLLARHYARQVAGLLGFEPLDRMAFAGAVFELAWNSFHCEERHSVIFALEDAVLVVSGAPGLHVRKALPGQAEGLTPEDVPWAVRALAQLGTVDLFEESHRQNQELLALLQEETQRRAPLKPAVPASSKSATWAA